MNQNSILENQIYYLVIILSFTSSFLVTISRIGFENDYLLVTKSFFTLIFLIFLPELFKLRKKFFKFNQIIYFFFSILIIIFINKINSIIYFDLSYLIFLLGFILLVIFLKQNSYLILKNKKIFFLFILFGIWACSAYYSNHYINPLIYEKIINGSWAHRDDLFHSALSGMIKTYGVYSNGINGLLPLNYHIFSHYIFAEFSKFLNVNTLEFYSIIFPIIIIPGFFYCFLFSCLVFIKINKNEENYNNSNIFIFWVFFSILFILPLPMYWLSENYQYLRSQSYNVALTILFVIISISISLYYKKIIKKEIMNIEDYFSILVLLILFYSISISKFSFLYFAFVSYFFFHMRLKLYKILQCNIFFILLIIISFIVYLKFIYLFQINWGAHGFEISYISRLFNNPYSNPYLKYLIPSFFYIILKFIIFDIKNFKKLKLLFFNKKILDIEFLIYIAIMLFLFPYSFTDGIQIYICYFLFVINFRNYYNFYRENLK